MTSLTKCLILFLSLFMLTACDSSDADRDDISSLALTPSVAYVNLNGTQTYTLVATYSDNSTSTVTSFADWSSSDTAIATIDTGVATGVSEGEVTITASLNGVSTTATLYVENPAPTSLVITPVNQTTQQGTQLQYTATLYYDDYTSLDVTDATETVWSSSDTSCATIQSTGDTLPGLAQALTVTADCETTINAIYNNAEALSDTTMLSVSAVIADKVIITPVDDSIANGQELQYTATVTYNDNSTYDATTDTNTTWSSSTPSTATIGEDTGYATSVAVGHTTISVSFSDLDDSTSLTVTDKTIHYLTVTPQGQTIGKGAEQQYIATVTYTDGATYDATTDTKTSWSSSVTSIATISNEKPNKGLAQSIATGQTDIKASFYGLENSSTLTVTSATPDYITVAPQNQTVGKGAEQPYTATLTYTDGWTEDVTYSSNTSWSSDTPAVAIVVEGHAKALTEGSANIIAHYQVDSDTTLLDSSTLTVTSATPDYITVAPQNQTVGK
uniref:Ig-like domain-containing protein n=1 Tax=uncultured Shewanella sp. TaxID=173975 RepID=UPI00261F0B8B